MKTRRWKGRVVANVIFRPICLHFVTAEAVNWWFSRNFVDQVANLRNRLSRLLNVQGILKLFYSVRCIHASYTNLHVLRNCFLVPGARKCEGISPEPQTCLFLKSVIEFQEERTVNRQSIFVFWWGLIGGHQCLRKTYCRILTLKKGTVCLSETLVSAYIFTRRYYPGDKYRHLQCSREPQSSYRETQ
jgi:hypothetical protein